MRAPPYPRGTPFKDYLDGGFIPTVGPRMDRADLAKMVEREREIALEQSLGLNERVGFWGVLRRGKGRTMHFWIPYFIRRLSGLRLEHFDDPPQAITRSVCGRYTGPTAAAFRDSEHGRTPFLEHKRVCMSCAGRVWEESA